MIDIIYPDLFQVVTRSITAIYRNLLGYLGTDSARYTPLSLADLGSARPEDEAALKAGMWGLKC